MYQQFPASELQLANKVCWECLTHVCCLPIYTMRNKTKFYNFYIRTKSAALRVFFRKQFYKYTHSELFWLKVWFIQTVFYSPRVHSTTKISENDNGIFISGESGPITCKFEKKKEKKKRKRKRKWNRSPPNDCPSQHVFRLDLVPGRKCIVNFPIDKSCNLSWSKESFYQTFYSAVNRWDRR